jgi:putative hemolysin
MMSAYQTSGFPRDAHRGRPALPDRRPQPRFSVRLAHGQQDVESALQLRSRVFNDELKTSSRKSDIDRYDTTSDHLIACDQTGATVGTYRLNTIETAGSLKDLYSAGEFTLEDIPDDILQNGVEIGRACIARECRNTKVLFLLWAGLLKYLETKGKRYFFGCCSIFTLDEGRGAAAYRKLVDDGHLHPEVRVEPRTNPVDLSASCDLPVEMPPLFNMYLRLGAKVCGPPMIDREFGSIDFFVLLDIRDVGEKYRRMFAAA